MSQSDNELRRAEQQAELPADLVQLENELRMLQPKASSQLDASAILAEALRRERDAEASQPSPRMTTSAGVVWSVACASAIISSALTAFIMMRFPPEPEVVERVRVVYAPSESVDSVQTSSDIQRRQAKATITNAMVWSPIGSRAAEIRQLDLLLQADADRKAPEGGANQLNEAANRPPSFMRLQRMLKES